MTLINVNNPRDAIDLAKRVLTKEKLDRQLTGQSSTPFMRTTSNDNYPMQTKKKLDGQLTGQSSTPFMRMTSNDNHPMQTNSKKGVTFNAMETLERNSNCIDRLM